MFELIFTVCINLSTCIHRPVDQLMPLDKCLELLPQIDAKQGILNCMPEGTVQRFTYDTERELGKKEKLAKND